MVSKKKEDRLPPGWKLEIRVKNSRKFKCYINLKTHKKFYSKVSMLRYIKDRSVSNKSPSTTKGHVQKSSEKKRLNVVQANESDEWLPIGWIMESRTRKSGARKGTTYKCYIDPATGSKFFSKPEVYRYLESMQINVGSSQQREEGSSKHSSNKVVVQRTIDDKLPSGWIKEIRNKMIGKRVARSDPFYIDTATGLVFRSKPDALRYIRTGEISKHAYRRKNGSTSGEEFALVKTSPLSPGEREKVAKTPTRKQLFPNEVSPKQCISALSEASGTKEPGSRRTTRSSSRVGLAPVHEASLEKSTLLQPATIAEEMIPEKSLTESHAATEVGPKQCISALPEASGIKQTGSRRSTRSSSRIGRVPLHEASFERSTLLQPATVAEAMIPEKSLTEKLVATEVSPKQCISALPEVSGIKQTGSRRHTRSSFRAGLLPVHEANLEQSTLLQPAIIAEGTIPEKSLSEKLAATEVTEGVTKVSVPVLDIDGRRNDDTHCESKPSTFTSKDMPIEEKPEPVALKGCSNEKAQVGKRKMKDRKTHTLPSRSSRRLAGGNVEVVSQAIPIEHALRVTNRSSIKNRVNPSSGSIPSESQEKPQTLNVIAQNGLAFQEEKLRPLNIDTKTVLATPENSSKEMDIVIDIVTQINAQVLEIDLEEYPPGFDPRTEALPIKVGQSSVDPADMLPGSKMEKSSGDNQLTEREPAIDPAGTLGGSKMEKSPRDSQLTEREPETDPTDKLAASKMDKSPMDSQLTEREPETLQQGNIDKSSGEPETLPEGRIDKSSGIGLILKEQQGPCPASRAEKSTGDCLVQADQSSVVERGLEQPDSQFSLSSPLWSDPCLEFAYKTLTGAIPLDDNLAIEDYIQHQLRTSEQSNNSRSLPDIGMPSFFQSHEPKPVSPFPKDVSIPNSNGFGSQQPSR